MYGLDKLSVYVEKHPIDLKNEIEQTISSVKNISSTLDDQNKGTDLKKIINTISINHINEKQRRSRIIRKESKQLDETNLCNFVTRNNYALFTSSIHLECNKPLVGRFIYIQTEGRNNRWSRLFSAVFCEIQAYEV